MKKTTRLTTYSPARRPPGNKVPAVGFRRIGRQFLITNDTGHWNLLDAKEFKNYLGGRVDPKTPLGEKLLGGNLMLNGLNFQSLAEKTIEKELLRWPGPMVHTLVVTQRCNFKCLYCHASVVSPSQAGRDMTLETAKRAVDFIFSVPNPTLMIEFQGGEPLLNWPAVRFIVEYSRKKELWEKRKVFLSIISNLSLMEDQKLLFLAENNVSICTSLDGPPAVHDKNRIYMGGNAHAEVARWVAAIQKERERFPSWDKPNAICTITKHSFPYWKQIVDELVSRGMERIQLGPLDPLGFARKSWSTIGYEPEEFVEFYEKALDYILALNRQGARVYEKMAMIFLVRILQQAHWRFPSGDALCRLAYSYNGDIYTSEEGRLLAHEGDEFFKIGNVATGSYPEILDQATVKTSLLASNSNCQPLCFQCAYKPYCTVLPVMNYAVQGNIWGNMPVNRWCRTVMGIFDILFRKLQSPDDLKLLESWLAYRIK